MAFTKVLPAGISSSFNLTVDSINSVGVVTATELVATTGTFSGNVSVDSINSAGLVTATELVATTGTFSGNVSVGGTLTYEDVSNIDSVGVITARDGLHVTGGSVGIGTDVPDGKLDVRGTIFVNGDGTGGRIFASGGNLSLTDGNGRQTLRIDDPGSGNIHTHVFNSDGYLGIGTDNPTRRLHVQSPGSTSNALFGNSENNNSIEVTRTGSTASYFQVQTYTNICNVVGGPTLTFKTSDPIGSASTERLRITSDGHKVTMSGSILHGSTNLNFFTDASRGNYNNISIRAGDPGAGTTPTNDKTAIKIYPAGVRSSTVGDLTGGIAWQHLDPDNGSWDTLYGAGAQIWMGAAIHDVAGQELDRFNLWMNSSTTGNSNPNNLAIEAYPSGIVRHPKVPAFMVSNSTTTNAFASNAKATWDVITLNNGSHFSNANDRFVCPVDGLYYFSSQMLSNSNSRIFHQLNKNGARVYGTRTESYSGADYQTVTFVAVVSASANDYFEVEVGANGGYGNIYANFNGYLIG